ncbi:AOX, alternative oxidase mitochondrial precursor [Artomyces pyxidatus]|uniref:AOX, alternative oxidase mitochondrial n=1 Tax=Artomyces pyxidatus TaxID=48021 RepID=A0ACB8SKE1_9AGAM|nr:AOX, alternative oxidase mitochondrial precursor [Artomyces pyxidatus]
MLKTLALRSVSLHRAALPRASAVLAMSARRSLTTSTVRSKDDLKAPPITEPALAGTEGAHGKDTLARTLTDDAHNEVRGDWVLFHPVYSPEELKAVEVLHRDAKTFKDKLAVSVVRIARWGFDLVSGYKHKEIPPGSTMTLEELRKGGYVMTEHQWLNRILFLESIAGVPGMVAGALRHLKSLRLMKRDAGWIHTLLEEAENERMHLMTFMTLRNPGVFFRALILGAQGVFYNMFFLSYLISPSTCHRFVGYLEEEAVLTYTRAIEELESGRLPLWANTPAPSIAIDYWRLKDDATLTDVLYAVRSDETTHRFVNHSLANLDGDDVNPFALREPNMLVKGKLVEYYVHESQEMLKHHQPPSQ